MRKSKMEKKGTGRKIIRGGQKKAAHSLPFLLLLWSNYDRWWDKRHICDWKKDEKTRTLSALSFFYPMFFFATEQTAGGKLLATLSIPSFSIPSFWPNARTLFPKKRGFEMKKSLRRRPLNERAGDVGKGVQQEREKKLSLWRLFFRQFCFLFASRDRFSSALKGCGGGGGEWNRRGHSRKKLSKNVLLFQFTHSSVTGRQWEAPSWFRRIWANEKMAQSTIKTATLQKYGNATVKQNQKYNK